MDKKTVETVETVRRALYFTQRTIGDAQAASRGPAPLAKRVVRRAVVRSLFKALGL